MTKSLVRISVSYGKGDGEEVSDQFLIDDTPKTREDLIDDYSGMFSECYEKDEFINGEIDGVYIQLGGGDWDDPTGRFIAIYEKDELINEVKATYEKELAEIERLFNDKEDGK